MLVKVRTTREGLKTGVAPVSTEVLKDDTENQVQPECYFEAAVVLFARMLEQTEG